MSTRKREVPGPLRRKSAVIWNYPATNTLSAVFGPSNIRVELVRIAVESFAMLSATFER